MKAELLAPAGNLKKLKLALYFGADAVYLGGKSFSLRTFADNFTDEELKEGLDYAHARGKKVYVAANIFARNSDLALLGSYFERLQEMGADGVLVSDMGALSLARRHAPRLPVHISTQANVMNVAAAQAYYDLGARRVVLAREVTVEEIAEIHAAVPALELEAFVHGAACVSYSGRCYLSDYLDGRSSNRGACVQACRYAFEIRAKDQKSGWLPLEEDDKGTYLLNSKDLNLSARLPALAAAGVCSFKIEGRMKSEYYLATVVNAYRHIMDMGYSDALGEELNTLTHREYADGFSPRGMQSFENSQRDGSCEFIAIVQDYENGRASVEMRSRFFEGDTLEVLSPHAYFGKAFQVAHMEGPDGLSCTDAKLVQAVYKLDCPYPLHAGDILRRRK